jgi:hypothetical protein
VWRWCHGTRPFTRLVPRHLLLFQSSTGGVLWCSIYDTYTRTPSITHTHTLHLSHTHTYSIYHTHTHTPSITHTQTPRVLRMDTPHTVSLSLCLSQYFTVHACMSLMCGMYARMSSRMLVRARDEQASRGSLYPLSRHSRRLQTRQKRAKCEAFIYPQPNGTTQPTLQHTQHTPITHPTPNTQQTPICITEARRICMTEEGRG